MSAPSSYKPSDMIQSMEVKISTFTQQFTQTQIDSLQLGKKNEIRLTNQAMVNYVRNSNLSSLTPSIDITPKYTILNQQTSGGPGSNEPPAIANAGAITSSTDPFGIFPNLYNTSTSIGQYTYNGQTIPFTTTSTLAVDALGNYVCLGANYDPTSATNYIELYVFNPVTSASQSSLTCIKYTSYSQYNLNNNMNNSAADGGGSATGNLFVPMIVVRTDGNYVITALDINNNVNFCLVDGSQTPTWGTIIQTIIIGPFSSYVPASISTDYYENLYVVEGLSNIIYCYSSTGTQIAKSSNSIIDQNNNPVQNPGGYFNFGYFNMNSGTGGESYGSNMIAAALGGEITVCDYMNNRIVSFTVDTSTQGIQISSVNSIDLTGTQQGIGIAFDANGLFIIARTIDDDDDTGSTTNSLLIYNDQNLTTNNRNDVLNTNTSIIDQSVSTGNFSIDSNGNLIMCINRYYSSWDASVTGTSIQVFFSNPS